MISMTTIFSATRFQPKTRMSCSCLVFNSLRRPETQQAKKKRAKRTQRANQVRKSRPSPPQLPPLSLRLQLKIARRAIHKRMASRRHQQRSVNLPLIDSNFCQNRRPKATKRPQATPSRARRRLKQFDRESPLTIWRATMQSVNVQNG